ncbi:MAG TPA: SRPBCC domain-containing protein [Gemmatimonadaceae bacterium]|jgi:uncharacterized protein YndB with AHSA1/START domain
MATQSTTDHVAHATTTISAPSDKVWDALTNPDTIKQYMMGATVTSDWKPGSPITWKGEMKGKPFEDKGKIQRVEPGRLLEYTHYSPISGEPDTPESYHLVTVTLSPDGQGTRVDLTQTKNPTEAGQKHSEENWTQMLAGMKKIVEGGK